MFQISRWLSLYWFVLLPLISWLATLFLYITYRRILIDHRYLRWLLIALIAIQIHINLLIWGNFYETALWLHLTALIVALAVYRASSNRPQFYQERSLNILSVMGMVKITFPFLLYLTIAS